MEPGCYIYVIQAFVVDTNLEASTDQIRYPFGNCMDGSFFSFAKTSFAASLH
jgi:hypothetical protein